MAGCLREKGVNRSGNIFVPNERYVWYYNYMMKFLPEDIRAAEAEREAGRQP